ncbi:hypothetical protein JTB14_004125 [Gonioctena quinquepunctata]|nr:hypothetical protein JTB14_004125 [Gonioctena quinquepunctata]
MTKKKITRKSCGNNVTKTQNSLQCNGGCERWFHKECTKLSNKEYEKYCDKKSRDKWICDECIESSSGSGSESDEVEDGQETSPINSTKKKIKSNEREMEKVILKKSDPSNREMLQFMTKKFAELEKSVIFNSDVMDDLQKTLKNLNSENSRLKKEQLVLNKRINDLEHKVLDMHKKITHDEMKQKSCNIVVVGINSDNVQGDIKKSFQKLKFEIQEEDYRLQVLPSKLPNKPVLVKFHSAELRQRALDLHKSKKKLDTEECGITGERRIIYFNEDLPKDTRILFQKARELRSHNFRYVWVKNGRVYARKDEGGN